MGEGEEDKKGRIGRRRRRRRRRKRRKRRRRRRRRGTQKGSKKRRVLDSQKNRGFTNRENGGNGKDGSRRQEAGNRNIAKKIKRK